ncbi:MAG: thiol:disulfide interchange protein DsbA/DsbL [Magnetococcales bacterium]|nr:thiol:disulfide interchange protein DsbA/DsbL [Magnetococcales bacterium]
MLLLRSLTLWISLLVWFCLPAPVSAEEGPAVASANQGLPSFESLLEGKHYTLMRNPPPITSDRPQVLNVFNFRCPHCFHLHPLFAAWAEKNQGRFDIRSVPIVFAHQSDLPVRAYFTALLLGKGKEMEHLLFKANFQDGLDIDSPDVIALLAEGVGLKADAFKGQLDSFGVVTKVAQAKAQAQAFGVTGTPSLIVNGRYLVQGSQSGDWERVLAIAETLATHEVKR